MKKKMLALALAMSFIATTLSGCGDKDDEQKGQQASIQDQQGEQGEQGETPQDTSDLALEDYTEPISYSVWAVGSASCSDISKTYLAEYIMDQFQIDITKDFASAIEDYDTKLGMAMTAGELPDIIGGWNYQKELFDQMAEEGLIMPLDGLVENYLGDYVDSYIQDGVLDGWRAADGKLYVLPSYTLPSTEKVQAEGKVTPTITRSLGIREDIFQELNLPIPTNADELYDALVKIKEADLTVDGETVYPFGVPIHDSSSGAMTLDCFESMFGVSAASDGLYFDEEAQEKLYKYDKPQYVEMLKYVTRLYRENILEADIFSQTADDIALRLSLGRYAVAYANPSSFTSGTTELQKVDENAVFVPIEPLYADGVDYSPYNMEDPFGFMFMAINANAEDPERLFKFIQWATSDIGFMTFAYGPPGEHDGYFFWDIDENGDVTTENSMIGQEGETEAWGGDCWFCNVLGGYVVLPINIKRDYAYLFAPEDSFLKRAVSEGYLETNYIDNLYMDQVGTTLGKIPDGPVSKANGTSVSKIFNEGIAKLIMEAQSDEEVETMWAEILENASKAGYHEIKHEEYELQYETYLELTAQ